MYLGRGSFSVVQLQTYRDIKVAVKECLPHSLIAQIFRMRQGFSLCHPHLPYVFGIFIRARPYSRVTLNFMELFMKQLHSIRN